MKFEVLARLFVDSNPGGSVDFLGNGKYYVSYKAGGKLYSYRSTSHYALAERFGLIPEDEPITDRRCKEIVALLRSGKTVLTTGYFSDTLRCVYLDTDREAIDCTLAGERDEFDRELWSMRLVTPDSDPAWWDYNVARWRR